MTKAYFLLLILLFSTTSCQLQTPENLSSYFNELHANKRFNGNVLIVKSDSIVHQNSLGFARGDEGQKLTTDHYFQVGSIYKEFPAVGIMQLKEKGLLSLDDKVSEYISGLPAWSKKVNIKNLLQYSSGLPTIEWSSLFQSGKVVNLALAMDHLAKIDELSFEPGSDYLYSNYNPFLLIRIIETISTLSFDQYLSRFILSPNQISGVTLTDQYPYHDTLALQFAYPFDEDFMEDDIEYALPSICATTEGMRQWFTKLDNFEIVSKESVRFLSKEAIEGDNIQAPLGRGDWTKDILDLHLHHGSTGNYECLVRNYKQNQVTIILLTNQKHRNLHDIADIVHGMLSQ